MSPRPADGSRSAFALFRWTATLLAVLALAQAGLAAGYLGGEYEALDTHALNGRVVVGLALVTALTALRARRKGGPLWPVAASLVLLLALAGELALGTVRAVAPHIAFGVLVVSGVAVLVAGAWAGAPRPEGAATERAPGDAEAERVSGRARGNAPGNAR